MASARVNLPQLLKLRMTVARLGEMDCNKWWNTKGLLTGLGEMALGRGFAFIDLCRQRYDVALMNPPFGDASLPSKPYLDDTYGDTKGDVYKAFVECFQARLVPAGYLGIISSRTGFFLGQSEDWRTRVVLRLFRPIVLADLGSGVLDAMVEVAAYVLRSLSEVEARDLTLSLVPVLEKVALDRQERFSLPKWQAGPAASTRNLCPRTGPRPRHLAAGRTGVGRDDLAAAAQA
jgi:hypothetical protein